MSLLDDVYDKKENSAWRIIDGSAFIVDSGSDTMHELNETGSRVWQLLDGKNTLRKIISAIVDEFNVSRAEAEKDVMSFMSELQEKKLARKHN